MIDTPTDRELAELTDVARDYIPGGKLIAFEAELRCMADRPHQLHRFLMRIAETVEGAKVSDFLTEDTKTETKTKTMPKDDGEEDGDKRKRTPNPFTRKNWNKTEQARIVTVMGEAAARRMAESAGSSLGATRPPGE